MKRADFEGALHAVNAIELSGHFAQFLRVDDLEEIVPLITQATLLRAFSLAMACSDACRRGSFLARASTSPAKTTAAAGAPPITEA